jgi:Lysozyme inhibitor LprI
MRTGGSISTLRMKRREMRRAVITAVLTASLCALGALAQAKPDPCDAYKEGSVPKTDLPTIAEGVALAKAGATGYGCAVVAYYGSAPNRFRDARFCAFAQAAMFRDGSRDAMLGAQKLASGGATSPKLQQPDALTLAMMYANGEGVTRNLKIAKHLACTSEGWTDPQEVLKDMGSGKRFVLCEEDGSRFGGRQVNYLCSGIRLNQVPEQLKRQRAATVATLSVEARPAFLSLEAEWKRLQKASNDSYVESCGNGNGCPTYEMQYDLQLQRRWVALLKEIESGALPAAIETSAEFPVADKELNRTYQGQLTDTYEDNLKLALRKSEREWLRYREAWVQFGMARWPDTSADQWRAWLTSQRTVELSALRNW